MQSQIKELEAKVEVKNRERQQNEMQSTQLRTKERELSVTRENHAGELVRLKERGSALQIEYDGIIAKLWDEYELTRSEAQSLAKEIDKQAGQKRLSEIRSRIKALGSVNVCLLYTSHQGHRSAKGCLWPAQKCAFALYRQH